MNKLPLCGPFATQVFKRVVGVKRRVFPSFLGRVVRPGHPHSYSKDLTMEIATGLQPVAASFTAPDESSAATLVEMMLKDPGRFDELVCDDSRQLELLPRCLAIGLVGFTIFGAATTLVLNASHTSPAGVPAAHWSDRSVLNLTLAYDLGLIAATGVCLPSFYFFGLLAGVKASMVQVTSHAMKGMAASAVALMASRVLRRCVRESMRWRPRQMPGRACSKRPRTS